jgi:hypothetical protein
MTVCGGDVERGDGFWKLNVSHLNREDYCALIENVLKSVDMSSLSIFDWWEAMKKRVKGVSMKFSRELAYQKRMEREQRINDIRCLARLCCWLQSNCGAGERVRRLGRGLKLINACSFRSVLLEIGFEETTWSDTSGSRARAHYLNIPALFRFASDKLEQLRVQEDDYIRHSVFLKDFSERAALEFAVRPSKVFFQQTKEKSGKERLISCLSDEGKEYRTTEQIQNVASAFYAKLWSKRTVDSVLQERFLDGLVLSLSAQERSMLDLSVSEEEICTAIDQMAKDKTPGLDGLPAEFYKTFKHLLSKNLASLCNAVFHSECTDSQKLAVISLLFKKGDRADIRNYRPISLLNVDYKICAKVLANRIKLVLEHVIHPDQSGFIPHGDIGENVLLSQAIINFCEEQQKDGYLVFLDWEKAFDRVDHNFMLRVLERMGFGEFFIGAVRALYTGVSSCICINQCISKSFPIHGGVRQGCPLSPYLFILVLECLAMQIRSNKHIVGITEPFSMQTSVLSLFADDVTVFLSSLSSAGSLQNTVSEYELATGSVLNKIKTVVLRVGPCRCRDPTDEELRQCPWRFVQPGDPPPKLLGMPVGPSLSEDVIFDDSLDKFRKAINFLSRFNLSYVAKAILFNSRLLPIFLYRARLCFCPTIHNTIKRLAETFLWSRSTHARISWSKLVLPVCDGGLNLVDPDAKILSMKATWLFRCFKNTRVGAWRAWFLRSLFLFCCTHRLPEPLCLSERSLAGISVSKCFISQVLLCWCKICNKHLKPHGLVSKNITSRWLTDVRLSESSSSPALLLSLFSRFLAFAIDAPAKDHSLSRVWDVFSSRTVYSACIQRFLSLSVPRGAFSVPLCNFILTCENVPARVRQFWFLLRHNSLFTLARLGHFVDSIKSDICPLCGVCREDITHAMSSCIFLRTLWKYLESYFNDQGFLGISMDDQIWCLLFRAPIVISNLSFPSQSCMRAICFLHYYHWKERESVIKLHRSYNLVSVVSKWRSHL